MAVTLRFDTPLNSTPPVDLRFGAPISAVGDSYIELRATIPAPTLTATIFAVRTLEFAATIPAPTMSAALAYDNAVYRGPSGTTHAAWQDADGKQSIVEDHLQRPIVMQSLKRQPWQDAQTLASSAPMSWRDGLSTYRRQGANWQDGIKIRSSSTDAFGSMLRLRNRQANIWQNAAHVGVDRQQGWQDRFRYPRPALVTIWDEARHLESARTAYAGVAMPTPIGRKSRWQVTRRPPAGRNEIVVPPKPGEGCYTPPPGNAVPLLFRDVFSTSANLLFSCEHRRDIPAAVLVPIKRTYIVLNDVHLLRVDGNHELPVLSLSLNIDMDSWTWQFSASLPASSLALVQPGISGDPVLLQATVNGRSYQLLAKDITRDRTFGKSAISVSGRGHSAMLADPYSPILSFGSTQERTAQQLMNDALTTNGVSIGWAVDWRIDDWVVPVGAWNHQGTYMSAVNAIAAAAGAFIQPDPMSKILRVRPRYPAKPWEWYNIAPDIELPAAAIVKESIAWTDKPNYNAVYISGTTAGGILGHVKRSGTAGDVIAPMITDALITQEVAARQRGINVLADTGRGADYSLSLPVLSETGIIDPGTLVRYVDEGKPTVGVVKGVSVKTALPSVRQTIEVLTHG